MAGHLGWSTIGTFFITSVATLPSELNISPPSGTGATQYMPSGEIGGWKSCTWF
jgi:hypothetical protein